MVSMMEASILEDLHPLLIVLYGATASFTVGIMLLSIFSSMFILVAI